MSNWTENYRRVLVVDDNESIHNDFRKILVEPTDTLELDTLEAMFHPETSYTTTKARTMTVLHAANQGAEAVKMVKDSVARAEPYDVAFVDLRMPPGMNGVETIRQLHRADIDLQVVLCTAFTDYNWHTILEQLGTTDRLLILKKPFDPVEVQQMVAALVEKRRLSRCNASNINMLEQQVRMRTKRLAQALKDISHVSYEKSRLLAAFSEQISQPLRSILQHLTRFPHGNSRQLDTQFRAELTDFGDHGNFLLNMTEMLGDAAQLELGSLELKRSPVNSSTLFASVLEGVEPLANEREFAVSMSVNPSVPKVIHTDRNRARRLLQELLELVIRFSTLNHSHLYVDSAEERDEIQCRLIAKGPFFASLDVNKITDRLNARSVSSPLTPNGLAAPLAAMHRMANLLGGSITVVHNQRDECDLFLHMPSNTFAHSTTGLVHSST